MKALRLLRLAERTSIVVIFLVMVFLFFANIVIREVGGTLTSQFAWIEEAVRLLNLFLVFLGLGLALERGRHVGIDSVRNKLSGHQRRVLFKVIDAVGCLFSLYIALLGYRLMVFVLGTGQRSPTLDIPMGWIYVAPLVGFLLLALRYALSFFDVIVRFRNISMSKNTGDVQS